MSGETRPYATYKEYCGSEQPGVASNDEAIDWTQQQTTPDQVRIEAVLDTMALTGAQLLHVGVGNSKLAQRFASRLSGVDGLTVHHNEEIYADALAIANYTVYVLNKYSASDLHQIHRSCPLQPRARNSLDELQTCYPSSRSNLLP